MPLDAEHEPPARRLDRLGQAVERRVPGDLEAVADGGDPLVVMGLGGVQLLAGGARGERAGGQAHVVVGAVEAARGPAVLLVAELVGQVLAERSAERDVDQLHAAADAEHGHVALDRAGGECELRACRARARGGGSRDVGRRRSTPGRCRCRRRGSARRSDRASRPGRASNSRSGGIITAMPAGALDRLDVAEREQRGVALPHAPARAGRARCRCRSPGAASLIDSLRLARWIFPDAVLGSSSANSTIRGYLYGAVWCLTCSWSSVASAWPGANPSRSTTTARTTAPRSSSGAATTAASATASVRDERRLDLERADPVARRDDQVVGAPLEVQVAVVVGADAVAGPPRPVGRRAACRRGSRRRTSDRWPGRRARARHPRRGDRRPAGAAPSTPAGPARRRDCPSAGRSRSGRSRRGSSSPISSVNARITSGLSASPAATSDRSAGSGRSWTRLAITRYSVGAMHSTLTSSEASTSSRCAGSNRSSCRSAAAPRSHGAMNTFRADFDQPVAAVHHTRSPGRASSQCSAWSRWPGR